MLNEVGEHHCPWHEVGTKLAKASSSDIFVLTSLQINDVFLINKNYTHFLVIGFRECAHCYPPQVQGCWPRGGHSIVKSNTTCEQSLLSLYYMPWIIQKYMIFFLCIHNHLQHLLYFLKKLDIFVFVIIVLVQFCFILVRNGMFYY